MTREPTAVRPSSFTYVTRLPPSPSGVALYASKFRAALESLAPTRLALLPPAPAHSQRVLVLLRKIGEIAVHGRVGRSGGNHFPQLRTGLPFEFIG